MIEALDAGFPKVATMTGAEVRATIVARRPAGRQPRTRCGSGRSSRARTRWRHRDPYLPTAGRLGDARPGGVRAWRRMGLLRSRQPRRAVPGHGQRAGRRGGGRGLPLGTRTQVAGRRRRCLRSGGLGRPARVDTRCRPGSTHRRRRQCRRKPGRGDRGDGPRPQRTCHRRTAVAVSGHRGRLRHRVLSRLRKRLLQQSRGDGLVLGPVRAGAPRIARTRTPARHTPISPGCLPRSSSRRVTIRRAARAINTPNHCLQPEFPPSIAATKGRSTGS